MRTVTTQIQLSRTRWVPEVAAMGDFQQVNNLDKAAEEASTGKALKVVA